MIPITQLNAHAGIYKNILKLGKNTFIDLSAMCMIEIYPSGEFLNITMRIEGSGTEHTYTISNNMDEYEFIRTALVERWMEVRNV